MSFRGSSAIASRFDVVTDQTAAHDLLHGYVPAGYTAETPSGRRRATPATSTRSPPRSHVTSRACSSCARRGAIAFEYGNNIRAQARDAGVAEAMEIPGFVPAYVRPLLARGIGPYRWIALSGRSGGPARSPRTR